LLSFSKFDEQLFSFSEAIFYCFDRLFGEILVFYNKLMEVIPEKISANMTSMTIVDAKE